jgi:aldose 1-epimerase
MVSRERYVPLWSGSRLLSGRSQVRILPESPAPSDTITRAGQSISTVADGVAVANALTINDGVAEAVIVPNLGAGLASYDLVGACGPTPLLRPCRDPSRAGPFDLALNLLVPWSNRISGGGFHFDGQFHPLIPNVPGERFPIHGDGFASRWAIERATADSAGFSLRSDGPGPFRYEAHASYSLTAGALAVRLSVRNLGPAPLPFGLGFHPWIVRSAETQLQAKAERVVLETRDHLPAGEAPVASRPEWDFAAARVLPSGWINNAFLGWDGHATVLWPEQRLELDVKADPPLSTYILYSPSDKADFFCFEPVTHPVDAHNLPGGPEANGLIILAPREAMAAAFRFRPRRLSRDSI